MDYHTGKGFLISRVPAEVPEPEITPEDGVLSHMVLDGLDSYDPMSAVSNAI